MGKKGGEIRSTGSQKPMALVKIDTGHADIKVDMNVDGCHGDLPEEVGEVNMEMDMDTWTHDGIGGSRLTEKNVE